MQVRDDPKLPDAIKRSFQRAGLFPLVSAAAPVVEEPLMGSSPARAASDSKRTAEDIAELAKTKLSQSLVPMVKPNVVSQQPEAATAHCDRIATCEIENQSQLSVVSIVGSEHAQYGFLIRTASLNFFRSAFVAPAQESAQPREEERKAKKIKVPKKSAVFLRQPSTKYGLCVTSNILDDMDEQGRVQKEEEQEREQKKLQREAKRAALIVQCQSTANDIRAKLLQCNNIDSVLAPCTAPKLKMLYKVWVHPSHGKWGV